MRPTTIPIASASNAATLALFMLGCLRRRRIDGTRSRRHMALDERIPIMANYGMKEEA
jgi:hypothetical protein